MNTVNINWTSLIGKRALFSRVTLPPYEDRVMEVSPSGHHVRLEKNGWDHTASFTEAELLEPHAREAVANVPKAEDFTPEEVAELPFNLDLCFTPEDLVHAHDLVGS